MLITPINKQIYINKPYQQKISGKAENLCNTNPLQCDTFTPSISFKADIHKYAQNGDLEGVKRELAKGVDINLQNENGKTALNRAACNGRLDVVKEFLKHPDIDVNIQDIGKNTALICACFHGHTEIVKELLKHPDIDVNIQDDGENTALIWASYKNNGEIVKELLKHPDVDVSIKDNYNKTALDYAKIKRHNDIARMIENYVPGVDRREGVIYEQNNELPAGNTSKTYTPPDFTRMELELASTDYRMKDLGFEDLIKYIDSDGFNPNYKDDCGRNVIHLSMVSKDERIKTIISKALAKGVDINAVDIAGQTALMKAIKNLVIAGNDDEKFADLAVIKYIFDQNPNIEILDQNKQTAFHLVCMTTSVALLQLMLAKNPNILLRDVLGKRPSDYFKTDEMKSAFNSFIKELEVPLK